jgi:hypothetical protein
MSHGAPGGAAAPAQTGSLSDEAEKLNFDIRSLEYFLGTAVNLTHAELGYNDNINMLTKCIKENTAEISSTLAFATTGDILQSSFITAVTQNLKKIMHSWWGRIAPGVAMPMHLYSAIDELGQMVNYANTKANYTPVFPPSTIQQKVNFIPEERRDPHQVLIQELNRENLKNNSVSKNDKNKKGNKKNGKNGKGGNQKRNQNQNNGGNKGNKKNGKNGKGGNQKRNQNQNNGGNKGNKKNGNNNQHGGGGGNGRGGGRGGGRDSGRGGRGN